MLASAPVEANVATGGLGSLVAWRLEGRGEAVPEHLQRQKTGAAHATVTAPWLLERMRGVIDGPMLLLKGPEVAACYPRPALRPFGDLDVLVADVTAAERALVEAGFTLKGSEESILPGYIHDRPLRYQHLPLSIELHRSPGWLNWMTPPSNETLFAMGVPSVTGVDGVTTLPPAAHALFLAVHSWRHGPYHSLLQLIDIDLMRGRTSPTEIATLATAWRISELWRRTTAMIDWLFYEGPPPGRVDRYWARHLEAWRPRTTREYYVATRSKGLAADNPAARVRAVAADVGATVALRPGESVTDVVRYTWRQVVTRAHSSAHTATRRK